MEKYKYIYVYQNGQANHTNNMLTILAVRRL